MLTKWTDADVEKYGRWAYGLAMQGKTASYPSYRDGIKTWEDFIRRSEREDEEGLLFRHEGKACGWIEWYALPAENYAATVTFLVEAHAEEAVREFVQHVQARYPGCTLDIGMDAENASVCTALAQADFRCIERSVNHTLFFADYLPRPVTADVSLMTAADEADFRRLHNYPEMYWNADRILADLPNWRVYLLRRDGRAVGALVCRQDPEWPEVFSVDHDGGRFDPDIFRTLMTACLNDLKEDGSHRMTFFEEVEDALPILAELGFTRVGEYRAYRKAL